jgi:Tol biopolymer transport system component
MTRRALSSFFLVELLLLFFLTLTCLAGGSSNQIRSIAISPDGKFLAVDFGKDGTSFIYRVSVDTGIATRLTDAKTGAESGPAFSPDGKRIAYSYSPGHGAHSSIVIVNIDGSDPHAWPSSGGDDYWPVFSPDNTTIVFARSGYCGNYSPIAQPYPHAWSFYASDLDGTNLRELTSESFYMASPPSVSPDGNTMVAATEGLDTPRHIAVYSLDHSGKPSLSLRPHVPKEADHKDPILNYPNYMPDGKSILFMAASNGKRFSGYDYDVYRVVIETGAVERLTQGNGFASDLRVSADGKTAVFLKWRSDWRGTPVKNELYLLDLQSHRLTSLKISGLN